MGPRDTPPPQPQTASSRRMGVLLCIAFVTGVGATEAFHWQFPPDPVPSIPDSSDPQTDGPIAQTDGPIAQTDGPKAPPDGPKPPPDGPKPPTDGPKPPTDGPKPPTDGPRPPPDGPTRPPDGSAPIPELLARLTSALEKQKTAEKNLETAVEDLNKVQVGLDTTVSTTAVADLRKGQEEIAKAAILPKEWPVLVKKVADESKVDVEFTYDVIDKAGLQDDFAITELKRKARNHNLMATAELAKTPFGRLSLAIDGLRDRMTRLRTDVPQLVNYVETLATDRNHVASITERQIMQIDTLVKDLKSSRDQQRNKQDTVVTTVRVLATQRSELDAAVRALFDEATILCLSRQKGR